MICVFFSFLLSSCPSSQGTFLQMISSFFFLVVFDPGTGRLPGHRDQQLRIEPKGGREAIRRAFCYTFVSTYSASFRLHPSHRCPRASSLTALITLTTLTTLTAFPALLPRASLPFTHHSPPMPTFQTTCLIDFSALIFLTVPPPEASGVHNTLASRLNALSSSSSSSSSRDSIRPSASSFGHNSQSSC